MKQHEREGRASLYARTGMLLTCSNKPFFDEGHDDVRNVALPISVIICDAVYAFVIRMIVPSYRMVCLSLAKVFATR